MRSSVTHLSHGSRLGSSVSLKAILGFLCIFSVGISMYFFSRIRKVKIVWNIHIEEWHKHRN